MLIGCLHLEQVSSLNMAAHLYKETKSARDFTLSVDSYGIQEEV